MVGKVVQNDPGWGERTKNGWGNFANRNPVGGKFRILGGAGALEGLSGMELMGGIGPMGPIRPTGPMRWGNSVTALKMTGLIDGLDGQW